MQAGRRRASLRYRSRVSDQLGSARLEPVGEGPSALFDDPLALAGLAAAAAVAAGALPEREPHPGAFAAFEALSAVLADPDIWPAVFVRFEAGLLEELGFGSIFRAARSPDDRRSGLSSAPGPAARSARGAGEPYADRLLPCRRSCSPRQGGLQPGRYRAGLALTGHFLERFVFAALNRPLPPARVWLIDRLRERRPQARTLESHR